MTLPQMVTVVLLWGVTIWHGFRIVVPSRDHESQVPNSVSLHSRDRDVPVSLAIAPGLVAASMTVNWSGLRQWLPATTGVPGDSVLLFHCIGVLAGGATMVFFVDIAILRWSRLWRGGITVATIGTVAALCGLFTAMPQHATPLGFTGTDRGATLAYGCVFLGFIAALCGTMLIVNGYSIIKSDTWGSIVGLGPIVLGAAVGLVYVGTRSASLVTPVPQSVLSASLEVTFLLIVVGCFAPTITAVPNTARRHGQLLLLYRLWSPLRKVDPSIVLTPWLRRLIDVITMRDLRYRRARRIIEIHDGDRSVRARAPDEQVVRNMLVLTVPNSALDASVQATQLEVARRLSAQRGELVSPTAPPILTGGADFREELTWLVEVSRARRSRAVRRTIRLLTTAARDDRVIAQPDTQEAF